MKKLSLGGATASSGSLGLYVPNKPVTLKSTLALAWPKKGLETEVNIWRRENLTHLWRGLQQVLLAKMLKLPATYGVLYLNKQTPVIPQSLLREMLQEYAANYVPGIPFPAWAGERGFSHENHFLGLASFRVVTTAGVNFIVDAFQNSVELEILKYHGLGTGSTAEAAGDTALVTELTTEYTPDSTRATGTTTEGGSANVYRTVATNTLSGAGASLREHGILSQAATGGGTLLDRSVYALITLADGDSLQSTYDHTQTAGS